MRIFLEDVSRCIRMIVRLPRQEKTQQESDELDAIMVPEVELRQIEHPRFLMSRVIEAAVYMLEHGLEVRKGTRVGGYWQWANANAELVLMARNEFYWRRKRELADAWERFLERRDRARRSGAPTRAKSGA